MGAKTARSPVQPSRSSRCGQSVGTLRKLPLHAPHDVAVQLVQQRIRARERADRRDVGSDDDRGERRRIELARPAGDLRVPEAVEGERRFEDVVAAAEDEAVGRLGAAQRARAELIVLEHLGVPQDDLGACRSGDSHAHEADEVLPEVDEGLAGR